MVGCGGGCICSSLYYYVEIIGTWDSCPMTSCSGAKLCAGIVQYHPVYIPYVVHCSFLIITLFCWCFVFCVCGLVLVLVFPIFSVSDAPASTRPI